MLDLTNWKEHKSYKSSLDTVTWTLDDLSKLDWNATYMTNEIPENDNWNTFATRKKKMLENMYKEWNVPKEGSLHYMCIRPDLSDNLKIILKPYENQTFNYNFLKLTPGCSLMWHFDTYATFVKYNNIEETQISNICRTAIMMNDWNCGQVLQIGNKMYSHWQAGDTFTWKADSWHGLANFGPSDIIIGQVTFLDDNNKYTQ